MDTETLKSFFMWCTILNGALLVFWSLWCLFASDLVFRMQRRWFPMSKDVFRVVIYCFLGFFKLLFIMFNLVPYLALLIVGIALFLGWDWFKKRKQNPLVPSPTQPATPSWIDAILPALLPVIVKEITKQVEEKVPDEVRRQMGSRL